MANKYWVGGTGTWDPASTSWSTTSGGSSVSAAPLATDNAIFDANSGGGTVTVLDGPGGSGFAPECANLTCTGFTGSIDCSGNTLNVNGDVTLSTGGDYTSLAFYVISGTCTLTSVGKSLGGIPSVDLGATLTLADDVVIANTGGIIDIYGTFTTNNFNVTGPYIYLNGGTINMGSSTFTPGDGWFADPSSTVNAGTSTINISGVEFDGGGKTYYNLNIGSTLEVRGSNTFNTISNSAQPIAILFQSGSTQTVTNFTVSGTAGNPVTMQRLGSTRWTLSKASGTVSVDYLTIRGSIATGGAAWYAGANSTNSPQIPQNSGWIFTAPPGGTPIVISAGVTISGGVTIG
jgi:hypothetical protein